jgi:type VI secretion system Hcp family effector
MLMGRLSIFLVATIVALAIPFRATAATGLVMTTSPTIRGENLSAQYRGYIDLLSFSLGVSNGAADTSNGIVLGSNNCQGVTVMKLIDRSSPSFTAAVFTGTHFQQVTIINYAVGGNGAPRPFLMLTMRNVIVSSESISGQAGISKVESITFLADRIAASYVPTDASGAQLPPVTNTISCRPGAATSLTLGASPSSVASGSVVALTATVAVASGAPAGLPAPTGTVEFLDQSGTVLCSAVALNASLAATCSAVISGASGTTDQVTAKYSGDGNYARSIGSTNIELSSTATYQTYTITAVPPYLADDELWVIDKTTGVTIEHTIPGVPELPSITFQASVGDILEVKAQDDFPPCYGFNQLTITNNATGKSAVLSPGVLDPATNFSICGESTARGVYYDSTFTLNF